MYSNIYAHELSRLAEYFLGSMSTRSVVYSCKRITVQINMNQHFGSGYPALWRISDKYSYELHRFIEFSKDIIGRSKVVCIIT